MKTTVKWPVVLRIAARLSERHSATVEARSLDILHVAAAKALRSGNSFRLTDASAHLRQRLD